MNPRMIEAATAIIATLVLFLPILLSIIATRHTNNRAARLRELKKYSIRPLDLR